jgi:cell division protein FtsB
MAICVSVIAGSVLKDLLAVMDNKKKTVALQAKYNELLKEEKELKSEVTKLKDPEYVARYARETYFYSLPGEVIIKMN